MNFFSGFSLCCEKELFKEYIKEGDFVVSGFSLGAIKAFLYTYNSCNRVDLLQLFSPAFFQDRDKKFKRVQIISYQKDRESYEKEFLKNIAYPSNIDMSRYFKEDSLESLKELLDYSWSDEKLSTLVTKGVKIEVFLGAKDKIIDSFKAKEFFKRYATVYFIKEGGHILHG